MARSQVKEATDPQNTRYRNTDTTDTDTDTDTEIHSNRKQ